MDIMCPNVKPLLKIVHVETNLQNGIFINGKQLINYRMISNIFCLSLQSISQYNQLT